MTQPWLWPFHRNQQSSVPSACLFRKPTWQLKFRFYLPYSSGISPATGFLCLPQVYPPILPHCRCSACPTIFSDNRHVSTPRLPVLRRLPWFLPKLPGYRLICRIHSLRPHSVQLKILLTVLPYTFFPP